MKLLVYGSVGVLLVVTFCATADENTLALAVKSCQQDIEDHCGHVKMGEGRIWRCLLSNDDRISAECGAAMSDAALDFERVRAQGDEVVRSCETDRAVFCPTAEWGRGGVVNCLAMQSHTVESVSAGCRKMLQKHGLI